MMLIAETISSERHYIECPKCGARGGCAKHGLTSTGIDLRARANIRLPRDLVMGSLHGRNETDGLDAIKAMATRNLRA